MFLLNKYHFLHISFDSNHQWYYLTFFIRTNWIKVINNRIRVIINKAKKFFHISQLVWCEISRWFKISSPRIGQIFVWLLKHKLNSMNSFVINKLFAYRNALIHWIHRRYENILFKSIRKPLKTIITTNIKTIIINETTIINTTKQKLIILYQIFYLPNIGINEAIRKHVADPKTVLTNIVKL